MNGRILLAEDNVTNQKVAVGILGKFGLVVDVASNGEEAIQALQSHRYDLILMDVQMPVMDGFEATRQIRTSISATIDSRIPIIAMTAYARPSDRARCLAAGMNDYLSKPVEPATLAETILRWLPQQDRCVPEAAGQQLSPPDSESPATPVFDQAGMASRLLGDRELIHEVIAAFLSDMPKQIAALRMLIDLKDAEGAGRKAHMIKGAASNVGGEAMRAVAYEMEQAGKTGDLEVLTAGTDDLERQFAKLQDAMKQPGVREDVPAREEAIRENARC
jgi:CheY-like chemotaxis protein/HPt (histidine-containing phosphotransfer) domain-containing protein